MQADDVNRLIQHYPDIGILDAEQERKIALAMDDAMEKLAQTLLAKEHLLEQVMDILLEQYQTGPMLDELLTQYDLWLLGQSVPSIHDNHNVSYKSLSLCLIKLQCDRSSVFDLLLCEADQLDTSLEKQARALKHRYETQRNRLVQANMRLVMHIAKRYSDKGIDTEELVQEGAMGLLKAASKYNIHKGFRFTTYAYWWIQQAIKGVLTQKRAVVRLPTNISDRIFKLDRAKEEYFKANGVYPTVAQLQRVTGIDEDHIRNVQNVGNLPLSMNQSFVEDGLTLDETITSDDVAQSTPQEDVARDSDMHYLMGLLTHLPKRQQKIVRLYHGLGIHEGQNFREIAPQIGVTLERTRQLYHQSIKQLQELV
ncbi:MAG: hypothetical protein CL679_05525 [Bermanella sp.]|nr:hypothetical protein [Bermanella sp.]